MAMRYVSFGIYFLFLFGKFGGVYGVNNFTEFMKNDDLQDHTCSDVQTIFDDVEEGSLAHCVFKCSKTYGCYGVFHNAVKGQCVGCLDNFLKMGSGPQSEGTFTVSASTGLLNLYNREHCEDLGGHFADIKSLEEEQFIETYVISELGNDAHIWIGATDDQMEGTYLWHDGTRVEDAFVNWGHGEPNNYDQGGITERCAMIWNTKGVWAWNDVLCHSLLSSVCEFD